MTIYIGADHRGFEMKEELKKWLEENGHSVEDCGNDHLDPVDDYVDFGKCVAKKLQDNPDARGIAFCGSGIGISIVSNRFKGIRCGLVMNADHAKHGRQNDHINMISVPSEMVSLEEAKGIVKTFLNTEILPKDKYIRRAEKLDQL